MVFVLAGSASAIAVGVFLDKTHRYLLVLRIMPISATIVCILAMIFLPTGNVAAAAFIVCMGGIGIVPIMAVSYQLATECTHPV